MSRKLKYFRIDPKIILISLIPLFTIHTSAQDTLTVEQAVATALQNSYDIQLARNDSLIAAINYSYRNAAFYPQLNTNVAIVFNNNALNQKFESGNDRNVRQRNNVLTSGLGLNLVVFDGFKMFITRSKLDDLRAYGNLTIKNQVVNTVSDVVKAYYDIVYQKQLLRNTREQMVLSNDRLKLAQYKLDIGVGIKPDVLQAQVDFNTQRTAEVTQLATVDQRKYELNRLMNVPQSLTYEVKDTITYEEDLLLGSLLTDLDKTPQLELAQKNIDISKIEVREARADLFPVIALTGAYNFNRNNNNVAANPNQALSSLNRGFNYGLTASIPILNNYNIRRNIKQAQLIVDNSELQYRNQESQLNTALLVAYKSYDAQKKIVDISDTSVRYARENLYIEQQRYRLGNTTYIQLRQAEQNVGDARNRLVTARYNLKNAETELLRLKGELVREAASPIPPGGGAQAR